MRLLSNEAMCPPKGREGNGKDIVTSIVASLASDRRRHLVIVMESPVRRESLRFLLDSSLEDCNVQTYASLEDIQQDCGDLLIISRSSIPRGAAKAADYIESVKAKYPSAALLVMSDDDDIEVASTVMRSGATGYVMPSLGTAAFLAAIRLTMAGGVYAPTSLIEYWAGRQGPASDAPAGDDMALANTGSDNEPASSPSIPAVSVFTARELEVIGQLQSGQPNKLIAYGLNMSESTVKVHMRNIMRKLGATNRTQVVFYVRELKAPAPAERRPSMVAHQFTSLTAGRIVPSNGVDTVDMNRA